MRRLASLYLKMKQVEETLGKLPEEGNISDMYKRCNFNHLIEAVGEYSKADTDTGTMKSGLKVAIYYLLKSTSKILRGSYLIADKAEEIHQFVMVLEMHQHVTFGDAVYALNKNRQDKLRRPQGQPQESDINEVRRHTVGKI